MPAPKHRYENNERGEIDEIDEIDEIETGGKMVRPTLRVFGPITGP
jgi:hypothetical protein